MARLTSEETAFIVTRLACFEKPVEVQTQLRETFGVEVGLPQILYYDPKSASWSGLAKKWHKLFNETRAQFIRDTAQIPISHRAVRLRRIERLADAAEGMKNYPLVGQLLEQAAKETGDFYTNRRVMLPGDPAEELAKLFGVPKDELMATLGGADA